ncbi:MAG: hypothetical protein GY795_33390 [Desulfobacterales bacterium]|nr:hypothetical protein [Desulfobacterales bacterium]
MKGKYVAYYAHNSEYEEFESHKEAEKWLSECYENEDDGYSQETTGGRDYIAKITHRSKFIETDSRENYHEHSEECNDGEDCDEEEWPYSDFDSVGNIVLEEQPNEQR